MSDADSLDKQFRTLRAQQLASTFERVIWLDAALLAAIFAAVRAGSGAAHRGLLLCAIWMLGLSLALTLCIPAWRALVNAFHNQRGLYKMHWSSYCAQLFAAMLTGAAVLLCIVAFTPLV